jgi:hypothetical protein
MHLSSTRLNAHALASNAPLLPSFPTVPLPSHLQQLTIMAATAMSKIFAASSSRPYATPSTTSSNHSSKTVTPSIPRPESPYMPEPEVDSWCSVCDRLIRIPDVRLDEEEDEKLKSKTDANGVPQFIRPVPARIPSKKLKVSSMVMTCWRDPD